MKIEKKPLYSLISLEDFKAILGIDDREDKSAGFCLVSSTFSIEQYCKRRFLRKKYAETIDFYGDLILPLREYPVSNIIAAYSIFQHKETGELIEPDFYSLIPEPVFEMDIPYFLSLSPALSRYRGLRAIKAVYTAGYTARKVPLDLAGACMELASWNLGRYKGRCIGMTGNVRGSSRDGEHFELPMPENVRSLLEPYRRKVI